MATHTLRKTALTILQCDRELAAIAVELPVLIGDVREAALLDADRWLDYRLQIVRAKEAHRREGTLA